MELVLKKEEKISVNDYPFQNEYGGDNIGFGKRDKLLDYGITSNQSPFDLVSLRNTIQAESKDDRIILVSAPSILHSDLITNRPCSFSNFHIWIGVEINGNPILVSKTHLNNAMVCLRDIDSLHRNLCLVTPNYTFDCITYNMAIENPSPAESHGG